VAIKKVGKFKLVPSAEAQNYIQNLGQKLIPEYQRSLPATDPNKVPFRFFLVQDKSANAFALPNGTIVVFSGMLGILENEAQLAAVMGHEISHSIQEHTRLQQEYHRGKRTAMKIGAFAASAMGYGSIADILNLIEAAIRNGYSRGLENQSDRSALAYMIENGYDIREAPKVWKLMARKFGNQPTNFFYSSHDNHTKRRSYLMAELSANYPDVDYSALRTNEQEYRQIATLVENLTAKKKKK
jgi:predicted Zn-dependent protease